MNITKEQRFLELVNGLVLIPKGMVEEYPDSIFYTREDKVVFELINSTIWVRYYGFWDVFEKEYSMKYSEIQDFIRSMIEAHIKMKGYTPRLEFSGRTREIEAHLKKEGYTPDLI